MADRPRFVTMLTTPVMASLPYSTLFEPRITSMPSIPVVARSPKSNAPPMSFAGTPSMSTLLKFELPPRTNNDVAPRAPLSARRKRPAPS